MEKEALIDEIKTLNETIWENKISHEKLELWLSNFCDDEIEDIELQKKMALHLLSQLMYFGNTEIRVLLKYIYEEMYKYPQIRNIRRQNDNTTNVSFLNQTFIQLLNKTRFVGMGNASESGEHLLYYFRQENGLPKDLFIDTTSLCNLIPKEINIPDYKSNITNRISNEDKAFINKYYLFDDKIGKYILQNEISSEIQCKINSILSAIKYYNGIDLFIFIDDYCGSGTQSILYSKEILKKIKSINPQSELYFFILFATSKGLSRLRNELDFDYIQCVYELDDSFNCFSENSRYFINKDEKLLKETSQNICTHYGRKICPEHPLGYENGQKLISFVHNTPDNTLPIVWGEKQINSLWNPIFKRYNKLY